MSNILYPAHHHSAPASHRPTETSTTSNSHNAQQQTPCISIPLWPMTHHKTTPKNMPRLLLLLALFALCPPTAAKDHGNLRSRLLSKQNDSNITTTTTNELLPLKRRNIEEAFVSHLDADSAREHLQYITAVPHMAGTAGDLRNAEYVQGKWQSYGIKDAHIEALPALLSYPQQDQRPSLELLEVTALSGGGTVNEILFEASLTEPFLPQDPTSDNWLRNHTYLGYSPSGDVTAELVYANYGTPDDFQVLESSGVDIAGKVVLVRYGHCFRGLKVMNAQNRGAVGVLIYSDPNEDGFKAGQTYPDGPWRPSFGVQRGSVQFLSLCPGDPARAASTSATTEELCGYKPEELRPKIPVLPISYGDAEPFLKSLEGSAVAPPSFQGGLNITYHLGPSTTSKVHFATHNEETISDIWNVIGVVPSKHYGTPLDRLVVLGNHRDAWVTGAVDPNSGTAAQLEVAKGLGALLQKGWQPQRTIILCSWSGEELGLIGSTAWGEANQEELTRKAVAYINVDSAVSGPFFTAKATAAMRNLIEDLQGEVLHPYSPGGAASIKSNWTTGPVGILGSGSDYTVFLDRLGIASVDMGSVISREGRQYGMYHSTYDSFSWMSKFGDPSFKLHVMMAEFWGRLALRLADRLVLPFSHTEQGVALGEYVRELEALLVKRSQDGTFPHARRLDLVPLRQAVWSYQEAASKLGKEVAEAECEGQAHRRLQQRRTSLLRRAFNSTNGEEGEETEQEEEEDKATMALFSSLNDRIAFTERRFLSKLGLPHRRYFRHTLQAPGLYLGYEGESFPGITQAVNDGQLRLAQEQVYVTARCIRDASLYLGTGVDSGSVTEEENPLVAAQ